MLQSLQHLYALLPHPILANVIKIGLVCAAIVGAWETWKDRKVMTNEDTLALPAIWEEDTLAMPRVAQKRKIRPVRLIACAMLLTLGISIGFGAGRTIAAGEANTFRYCTGGACTLMYHDACSDWWQIQHDNQP